MFNIGGSEMVMLAILALLVFGPEGLPGIIKNVMRTVRAVRAAARDFQSEVSTALEIENERIDKSKRRRRTAPLNSSSLSGEVPNSIDEALPQLPEGEDLAQLFEKGEDVSPEENAETEDASREVEEAEALETLEAPEKEEPETESPESSSQLPEDDDDGPGLPMVRKKVEETA